MYFDNIYPINTFRRVQRDVHQLLWFVPGTGVRLGVVVEPGPVQTVPLRHPVAHQDLVGPGVILLPSQHLHFVH